MGDKLKQSYRTTVIASQQAMAQAMQETKQVKDRLKSLLGGTKLVVGMQN